MGPPLLAGVLHAHSKVCQQNSQTQKHAQNMMLSLQPPPRVLSHTHDDQEVRGQPTSVLLSSAEPLLPVFQILCAPRSNMCVCVHAFCHELPSYPSTFPVLWTPWPGLTRCSLQGANWANGKIMGRTENKIMACLYFLKEEICVLHII